MTPDSFAERLEKIERHKRRSQELSEFLRYGVEGLLSESRGRKAHALVSGCGSWLLLRDYFLEEHIRDVRLAACRYCRQYKLCGLCASLRAAKYARAYLAILGETLRSWPTAFVAHCVFTVRNGEDLRERDALVRRAMSALVTRRRNSLRDGRSYSELSNVVGGIWSLEIKRGKGSGLWHPHIHCLLILKDYIHAATLRAEWSSLTGREGASVWISRIGTGEENLFAACRECCKYVLKLGELSFRDNVEVFAKTRGQHFVATFGEVREAKISDDLSDEMRTDGSPFLDILLGWNGAGYERLDSRNGVVSSIGEEDSYSTGFGSSGNLAVVERGGRFRIESVDVFDPSFGVDRVTEIQPVTSSERTS